MITKKEFASIQSNSLFVEYLKISGGEDFKGEWKEGDENYEWINWADCKVKLTIESNSFSLRHLWVQYDKYDDDEDLYMIPDRDDLKTIVTYERNGQVFEYEKNIWKEDKIMTYRLMKKANPKLLEILDKLTVSIMDEDRSWALFGEYYEGHPPDIQMVERRLSFQEIEDAFNL